MRHVPIAHWPALLYGMLLPLMLLAIGCGTPETNAGVLPLQGSIAPRERDSELFPGSDVLRMSRHGVSRHATV